MTLGELLAWIDRSGLLVKVSAGRPRLEVLPGCDVPPEVVAALKENRGYFLALGVGGEEAGSLPVLDPPYDCGVCGRQVHCGDAAVVWQMCGNVGCPFWRPAFGPKWMGGARWWWNKARAEQRARGRSEAEGIPE